MSSEQREKSAVASRGQRDRDAKNQRGSRPPSSPKPKAQPGGGRASESEKPTSPNSRWGGGR